MQTLEQNRYNLTRTADQLKISGTRCAIDAAAEHFSGGRREPIVPTKEVPSC